MLPLRTATLAVLILVSSAQAGVPRDDVLRFVPSDSGFCVLVRDLRGTGKALLDSPFVDHFRNSAIGQSLATKGGLDQLDKLENLLKEELGITFDQLRDDILGDAVVFVYRPGPIDKPNDAQTLLLIRARTDKALSDLVERYNANQKKAGKLKLVEWKYKEVVYLRRELEEPKPTHYFLRGPVLVFAREEDMIRRAIDADLALRGKGESPLGALMRQLGADKALFAIWVNPRAFDADLNAKLAKLKKDEDPSASVLEKFLVYWKALDALCVSLTLDRDVTLAVGVQGRSELLPPAARTFFTELSRPSALWTHCPEKPLLAIAGRFDFAAFVAVLDEFLSKETQQAVRADLNRVFVAATGTKDVVAEILPHVGKDVGLFVATPTDPKQMTPVGMFALRVPPGDRTAIVGQALIGQLQVFARVACLTHNKQMSDKPMRLETVRLDKLEIHYLDGGDLPTALRPAFALKDGFLVVASSVDAVRGFSAPSTGPSGPAPLVRVSFVAWRGYLKDRRDFFVKLYAEREQIADAAAASHLDTLLTALEFLDQIELRHETSKGQAIVSLTLKLAKPLRK